MKRIIKTFEELLFGKIQKIDDKHAGRPSWDEEDLVELGKFAYNLALEDVRGKLEATISYLELVFKSGDLSEYGKGEFGCLLELKDFISKLAK